VEQEFAPDALLVEVGFLPSLGRATNVVLTESNRPYEIAMGTNSSRGREHTLPLSDLVVGCTERGMYLKSRSLGREVIPKAGHALDYQSSPNVYRFLREVGLERMRPWFPIEWKAMEGAPFLPRLRYGKVVIQPATWRLNENTSVLCKDMPAAQWLEGFGQWRTLWKVPRYVYMIEGDNRILLDLEHPLHLDVLQKEFTKGTAVELIEMGVAFDEQCVETATGPVMNEVIIPLVKKDKAQRKTWMCPNLPVVTAEERLSLPGSSWLFFKLYGVSVRQEELIGGSLREFCAQVEANGLVEKSYFMRYLDPKPHIRLRFNGDAKKMAAELLPLIEQWARGLEKEGLLSELVMDTYDPEMERYGGPQLMKLVENYFAKDSIAVASWIHGKRFQKMGLPLDLIGVMSVIDILEGFGMSFSEQFRWLDMRLSHKEYLDEFRKHRSTLIHLANSSDDWAALRQHAEGQTVYAGMQVRREALQTYAQEVQKAEARGDLYNSQNGIIASVIHLHLNRLLGVDLKREEKVMILTRHTLNALRHFRETRV
jgi:thiopeptide-type bacteriocin biosynthesis protein